MKRSLLTLAFAFVITCGGSPPQPDVVIVGAGIAGLSAAVEAADHGLTVEVLDLWSVFGGHAVQSGGVLSMVDTPMQRAEGIRDDVELAYADFIRFGGDADPEWARRYVEASRTEIYDWLTGLGVEFETLMRPPGNSVFRVHLTRERGRGLVTPIYLAALSRPGIHFHWNERAVRLIREGDRIAGVETVNMRTAERTQRRAGAVVLATGGFQGNLNLVRQYWRDDIPFPERFLVGAGLNAHGSGLELASEAGAALERLDHQWNYATGMRDPRFPDLWRGVNAHNFAGIWVNLEGRRFVNESYSAREALPALIGQPDNTYWLVFDAQGKGEFGIYGTGWDDPAVIEDLVFSDPAIARQADSIAGLAAATGLPADRLEATLRRYNGFVAAGSDTDFGRFGPGIDRRDMEEYVPARIERPPFYAIQFYPMTRKSMGGVAIDSGCRVVTETGEAIAGLYAAGEVTGFGGVNGRAGLEGTFLGPSILTGRTAARTISVDLAISRPPPETLATRPLAPPPPAGRDVCTSCHPLAELVAAARPGFVHFEVAHRRVLAMDLECTLCHSEINGLDLEDHLIDRRAQAGTCGLCH